MPVDLSKIGLVGIESYHDQQESKARTNYNNVLADTGRAKLETDARNRSLIEQATAKADAANMSSSDNGEANRLAFIGQELIRNGGVEMGGEILKQVSEIEENQAQARKLATEQLNTRSSMTIKTGQYVADLFSGVTDETSFNFTLQQLKRAQAAGEIVLPEGILESAEEYGYSPEHVKIYQDHAIKAVSQATLDMQAQGLEERRLSREQIGANADRNFALAVRRQQAAEQHRRDMIAAGGSKKPNALTPTEFQVRDVKRALLNSVFADAKQSPKAINSALDTAASYVASDAVQRVANSKGSIPWAVAVEQAKTQAIVDNVIERTKERDPVGIRKVKVDPTKGLGRSPETALPKPANGQLQTGKYYLGKGGQVGRWNGSTMVIVP